MTNIFLGSYLWDIYSLQIIVNKQVGYVGNTMFLVFLGG